MKNEIVKKEQHTPSDNDYLSEIEAHAGIGKEDVTARDLTLPFWKIIQSNSLETKRSDQNYVEGAREGQWFDTVTAQLFDALIVVPARHRLEYVEWYPRKTKDFTPEGKGFVKNHGLNPAALGLANRPEPRLGRNLTPQGTEIIETGTWYIIIAAGLRPNNEGWELSMRRRGVIAMSRTQLKIHRKWSADLEALELRSPRTGGYFRAPDYYMSYMLTTVGDGNELGNWMIPKFARNGPTRNEPEHISVAHGLELWNTANHFSLQMKDIFVTHQHVNDETIPTRDLPF